MPLQAAEERRKKAELMPAGPCRLGGAGAAAWRNLTPQQVHIFQCFQAAVGSNTCCFMTYKQHLASCSYGHNWRSNAVDRWLQRAGSSYGS